MANTIQDLYLKYVGRVGKTLEKDRYFQYLFEMVQAGSNVLQQRHQVLHKVVDERWLTTIEDSLDAINAIIEKPRRFVTTSEEVVPVALARKITADSVRHLSMNTQFIASTEDGNIQPTKILNVTTEESYDLYENRFIYHLIQRLVTFIDKRTDVIFWSTGDETKNVLSYTSQVDDAYEEISYKLEMTIKNRQSFAENDSDNMQVFMRIDRVRRLVMALRSSSFCSLMAGCAKVRSPIQRTNLMMKDPNYRTCYKLWQFLESYDEVGYTIETQDTALEFDEEYLYQLYTGLITNYAVFQSLLAETPRDLEQASAKRRRVIKPKFIKKIEEQIVDDYDIPDVEVRQVIIEEVTQAQLDAEAKLQAETEARKTAEEALESMEGQMMTLQQQVMALMEASTQAEEQLLALQQEREQLEAALAAEKARADQCQQEAQEARETQEAQETQARAEMEAAQRRAEESILAAQAQAESEIQAAQAASAEAAAQSRAQAEAEIQKIQNQADNAIAETKADATAQIAEARNRAARESQEAQTQLENAQREKAEAEEQLQTEIAARTAAETAMAQAQKELRQAQSEAKEAQAEAKTQRHLAEKETRLRLKAQEKADANSLSKYIITAINGRKQKPDDR